MTGNPAEVVLVRTCSDLNKPLAQRYAYRNCIDGLIRITKDEGAVVLFKGLGPNIVRSVAMNVSQREYRRLLRHRCFVVLELIRLRFPCSNVTVASYDVFKG